MAIDRTRPEPGCSAARNCAFTSVMSLPGFNLILMSCAHISHPPLPDLAFPRRPGQHTIDDLSRATPLDQPQHRCTWRPTRTGTERGRRVGRSGGVQGGEGQLSSRTLRVSTCCWKATALPPFMVHTWTIFTTAGSGTLVLPPVAPERHDCLTVGD